MDNNTQESDDLQGFQNFVQTAPQPVMDQQPPENDDLKGFGSFIDNLAVYQSASAKNAAVCALDANPDQAARARQLAPLLGQTPSEVEGNLPDAEKQLKLHQACQAINENPALASYFAQKPEEARMMDGEYWNSLGFFAKQQHLISGAVHESIARNIGREADLTAFIETGHIDKQKGTAARELADQYARYAGEGQAGTFYSLEKKAIGMFADIADAAHRSLVDAGVGASIGAVRGGVVGGVPGAVTGGIGGAALGLREGIAVNFGMATAADRLRATEDIRDAAGNPMLKTARIVDASAAGGLTAILAYAGGNLAGGLVGEGVAGLAGEAATNALAKPTVMQAVKNLSVNAGKGAIEFGLINAGMAASEMLGEEAGKQVDGGHWQTVFNDPNVRSEYVSRLGSAFGDGVLLGAFLHTTSHGIGFARDMLDVRRSEQVNAQFQDLLDGVQDSKAFQRSPDLVADFLRQQAAGTPVENVYIPAERLQEFYQSQKADWQDEQDPFFGFVPDMKQQMEQGLTTGGDVVINAADYMKHVLNTDVDAFLREDLRVSPESHSMRDAKEFQSEFKRRLAEAKAEFSEHLDQQMREDTPFHQVYDDVSEKLRSAGYAEGDIHPHALLIASHYHALADMTEGKHGDAAALYGAEMPQLVRDSGKPVPKVQVGGLDLALNELRNEKPITDKKLYGDNLLQFIIKRGGIAPDAERAGEFRGMDADKVRGLVRKSKRQDLSHLSIESTLQAAKEAGYLRDGDAESGDLINAISDSIKDQHHYSIHTTDHGEISAREERQQLRDYLADHGLDVNAHTNEQIKTALKEVAGGEFHQSERGKINLADNVITLFKGADRSTLLHELGHKFLDELERYATMEGASDAIQKDWKTVQKYLGLKKGEKPTVEQHETFARSFEAYLMEGKAPSVGLESAFQKFATWLTRIYKAVKNLNVPMNDNVRAVFDRLVATKEEIDYAQKNGGLSALFNSAADIDMTDAEFKAYQKRVAAAQQEAEGKLLQKAMAAIKSERTKAWQENFDHEKGAFKEQALSRQDVQAYKALTNVKKAKGETPIKLDKQALITMHGGDGVLPELARGMVAAKDGIHPDVAAEMFGYSSGRALVQDLMNLEASRRQFEKDKQRKATVDQYLDALADEQAHQTMLEQYGDILNDGSIEQEAMNAVHNDKQASVLVTELQYLARQLGLDKPLTYEHMQAWAKSTIGDMTLFRAADLNLENGGTKTVMRRHGIAANQYLRAERKYAKEAQRALLAGKTVDAFQAKQKQLLNFLLHRESMAAEKEYQSGMKLFERLGKNKAIKTVDQGFLDQIHGLLTRVQLPIARGKYDLDGALENKSYADFIERNRDQTGVIDNMYYADFLMDPNYGKSIKDMKVDEFRDFHNAIKELYTAGQSMKEITLGEQKADFDATVHEIVANLGRRQQREFSSYYNPADEGFWQKLGTKFENTRKAIDASLKKTETYANIIDLHDKLGVFNQLINRINYGKYKVQAMRSFIAEQRRAFLKTLPATWEKRLREQTLNESLMHPETGEPMRMTRANMLQLMLNLGNDSNKQKLLRGYSWDEQAVWDFVRKNAVKEDWDYVQNEWKLFNHFWPEVEALERRTHGWSPEKVEATPIYTEFGDYEGGYYPMMYRDKMGLTEAALDRSNGKLSGLGGEYATTRSSATKNRNELYTNQVSLDLDVGIHSLSNTLYDIGMREPVMDFAKVLRDDRFKDAVYKTVGLGEQAYKRMDKWLLDVAGEGKANKRAASWFDGFLNKALSNFAASEIGFRVTTLLKHASGTTLFVPKYLGMEHAAGALRQLLRDPRTQYRWAEELFAELKASQGNIDRDFKDVTQQLGENALDKSHRMLLNYSHAAIGAQDYFTRVWVGLGAYNKAMAEGKLHNDAIDLANKAIRETHGSGHVIDASAVQRDTVLKPFTLFSAFMNRMYNHVAENYDRASTQRHIDLNELHTGRTSANLKFAATLGKTFGFLAMIGASEQIIAGHDKNDDESWAGWTAHATMAAGASLVPFLKDAYGLFAGERRNAELTPLVSIVNNAMGAIKGTSQYVSEGTAPKHTLDKAVQTVSDITGTPIIVPYHSARYLWDIAEGNQHPQGFLEFIRGLGTGHDALQRKH